MFHLVDPDGQKHQIDLETLYTFRMRGIGYTHPEFGHGSIHGELEIGHEAIKLDDFPDADPTTWHMQNVVVARMEGRTGIGVLEQALIGPHEPTGLTGFLNPAAGQGVRPVDAPEELTPGWLSEALDATVSEVSFEPVGTGQMSSCFRLSLDYSAGTGPPTLVAKLPSADPKVRDGAAITYATEVRFYRDLASTVAVRIPECYCAIASDDGKSFVLLLEDMSPAEQGDQIAGCSVGQAREALLNLAGLHGPRWRDESLRAIEGLAPFGADAAQGMGMGFGLMLEPFIERFDTPRDDADVMRAFAAHAEAWLLGRQDRFALVHGDYRLDNLLFATAAGGPPCTAVDWQIVAVGLPARDLGFFLGTGLKRDERGAARACARGRVPRRARRTRRRRLLARPMLGRLPVWPVPGPAHHRARRDVRDAYRAR